MKELRSRDENRLRNYWPDLKNSYIIPDGHRPKNILKYIKAILFSIVRAVPPKKLDGKIVGGEYASISHFPHAVHLVINCSGVNSICGSSVINQLILITAAHCLQCKDKFRIHAKAGDDDLNKMTIVRKVSKYKIHPGYSDTVLKDDIGLILITKSLPLGVNIQRVIIKMGYPVNAIAFVAGWGVTDDETKSRSLNLKKVQVPLLPQTECSVLGRLHSGMFCAGSLHNTKNRPSKGDSGSALITTDHQQLGMVSFRIEPYVSLLVYTNVSYYTSWIQKASKQLYCSVKSQV